MSLGVDPALASELAASLESRVPASSASQSPQLASPPPATKSEPSDGGGAGDGGPAKEDPPKKKPKAPKPKARLAYFFACSSFETFARDC